MVDKVIGLVGCGKSKLTHPAPAKDLYTGQLFKLARAYAERFCDGWGVLSAKHHFVLPDEVLAPYDLTLKQLDKDYLKQWQTHANWGLFKKLPWEIIYAPERLREVGGVRFRERKPTGLRGVRFVFLAGEAYEIALQWPRKYPATFPLRGMGVGKRLQWLSRRLSEAVPVASQGQLF